LASQPQLTEKQLLRIQFFAVMVGLLLLGAKFVAYLITHSNTILTDALESIINVVAGAFALYSIYLSSKPRDDDHPYGHGKVEFISAGFEGILIIVAGGLIIAKSIVALFNPRPLEHLDYGLIIVVVSGAVNFFIGMYLERVGNKINSMILKADGQHLKSDAYSSAGILVGIVLIMLTNWPYLDSIVAILFGFIIMFTGVKLVRKSLAGIMDEADVAIIDSVIELLNQNRKEQWIDVHNLRIIQYGNKLHIDCHVTLPWYFTLEASHAEIDKIADIINEKHSAQVEFFIHQDPCLPTSCKICEMSNCPVRTEAFKGRVEWTKENVLRNKRHGL